MSIPQYEIYHENKKHTSPEFPYNTYICTIPLDFFAVPTHWHKEVEIIVIKKGTGKIAVELVSVEVSAGDIIFVLPGQLHSIEQKDSLSMEYENIFFKPALLTSIDQDFCYNEFLQPLFGGVIDFPFHITPEHLCYIDLKTCIQQIDNLCSMRPKGYQLAIKGLLFQIFFLITSHHPVKIMQPKEKKALDKLKLVLSYIQEHYSRPISIKEISEVCFYSESHFMKFFKDCMGTSFTQYLNEYRLQVAAQLLKEHKDNILDVAIASGFENLSYFNRAFKKKYGITPGQYRKPGSTATNIP